MTDPVCRFPHPVPAMAAVRVSVPEGCICYPDDRVQELCGQHYEKMRGNSVEHVILVDRRIE